ILVMGVILAGPMACTKGVLPLAPSATDSTPPAAAYHFAAQWNNGTNNTNLSNPMGIAVDKDNHIYVVDMDLSGVFKFDTMGTALGRWGQAGSGPAQYSQPFGVAVDGNDNVYVADAGNKRVQETDTNGVFIKQL